MAELVPAMQRFPRSHKFFQLSNEAKAEGAISPGARAEPIALRAVALFRARTGMLAFAQSPVLREAAR